MNIAVTGGSGRIGRAVVELALSRGHAVRNVDRVPWDDTPANRHVTIDTSDYAAVEAAFDGCDAVVHLAAYPSPIGNPDHVVHNNNVVGSYNALSAAARLGINRVCLASSVNATGASYSRWPRYDYFPLDERHPTYNEDAYSLSKWVLEQQADSFARRYEAMTIGSLRFHWVTPVRPPARMADGERENTLARHLWGYTRLEAAARACLDVLDAQYKGHEAFYIVAPDTMMDQPTRELVQRYFPQTELRAALTGNAALYDCGKAERLLGWRHDARG